MLDCMFLVRAGLLRAAMAVLAVAASSDAGAAAPGIGGGSGTAAVFALQAAPARISQPDGQSIYSWGYGCDTSAPTPAFLPAGMPNANCPAMQLPGPTLIVNQGQTVTVTLTNKLPAAAGNTSILFPGFSVTASAPSSQPSGCTSTTAPAPMGVLTSEAAVGCTVSYSFVADTPGTHNYYSGTQGDLQVEMGLFGVVVVLPNLGGSGGALPSGYAAALPDTCHAVGAALPDGQHDFRLSAAAYDHPSACYDREYLFQFSEMDPSIHAQAEAQADAACANPAGCMTIATEPYHPVYFMVNGRSMPDDMDPNYAPQYAHQPYNGNPHMHPGELVLLRVVGAGRWQHPFHEHGNHVRVLARDGNLLLSRSNNKLAGPLLFTTTTTPGVTLDGIFQWTGKGLNWDVYGHSDSAGSSVYNLDPSDARYAAYNGKPVVCAPDANGYYTADPLAPNYYEWCADHKKALEAHPFGDVASGGPVTLPDVNILTDGAWYGGSAYLGPDATARAVGTNGTTPPSGTVANAPSGEAGYAYMWHSHNEREITTNNIFPGGMMMMMLVDPQSFVIIEAN